MPPEHRISCHRCGNIRKRRVLCPKSTCPHTFCGRCAEKLKEEHGSSVFMDGCPVCKVLCCCNSKSVYCHRKNHCYRKCPSTRSSSYTLKLPQDHHRPEYESDGEPTSKGVHRSAEQFVNCRETEATHTGIFDLLAAVADGVFDQRSFVEGTTVPAVRVAKSAIVAPSLNNAQAFKVACNHRATSTNRKKPKLNKQLDIPPGGAACFDPSLLQHCSRPPPPKGYFPPSMRSSNASSSLLFYNSTNSFPPGLGSNNSYSTAAAFNGNSCTGLNNYNPFHSSSVSSFLHLPEPSLASYPPLMNYISQKSASTDAPTGCLMLAEEESSGRSSSAAASDLILGLSMDSSSSSSKSLPYQMSLQHLLSSHRGGGMCELAVMPVDCGFDGYTGTLLQTTHTHPSTDGAGEGYSMQMNGLDPSLLHHRASSPTLSSTLSYSNSSSAQDQQSRDAKSVDHLLLQGAMKNPFLQPTNTAHMDAAMLDGLRLTNSFQIAHNSSLDMQLPSIPKMIGRSNAKVEQVSSPHSLLGSTSTSTSMADQRQMIANISIPVPNATTAALSENSPVIDASRLSIETTDTAHEQQQQQLLSSSSSSSPRLSAATIDDTACLCPMNLLALVSSFSKALDRPAVVEEHVN